MQGGGCQNKEGRIEAALHSAEIKTLNRKKSKPPNVET